MRHLRNKIDRPVRPRGDPDPARRGLPAGERRWLRRAGPAPRSALRTTRRGRAGRRGRPAAWVPSRWSRWCGARCATVSRRPPSSAPRRWPTRSRRPGCPQAGVGPTTSETPTSPTTWSGRSPTPTAPSCARPSRSASRCRRDDADERELPGRRPSLRRGDRGRRRARIRRLGRRLARGGRRLDRRRWCRRWWSVSRWSCCWSAARPGWWPTRALAPVERIRREVEQITGDRLDRRVPEPPSRDEIHRLARTMNQMLGRLRTPATGSSSSSPMPPTSCGRHWPSIRQTAEVARAHPGALPEGELADGGARGGRADAAPRRAAAAPDSGR